MSLKGDSKSTITVGGKKKQQEEGRERGPEGISFPFRFRTMRHLEESMFGLVAETKSTITS